MQARENNSFLTRLFGWIDADHRGARRYPVQELIAYYWTSGSPKACRIRDMSCTGMYLFTDERWLPGTIIPMTLQRSGTGEQEERVQPSCALARRGGIYPAPDVINERRLRPEPATIALTPRPRCRPIIFSPRSVCEGNDGKCQFQPAQIDSR